MKVETFEAPKPVLVIEVPKPFPYISNKTVPWDYRCNYANEMTASRGVHQPNEPNNLTQIALTQLKKSNSNGKK